LSILVRCKSKGAVGALCTLIANYCMRWRCKFKGINGSANSEQRQVF
jgi:hypothetical protein